MATSRISGRMEARVLRRCALVVAMAAVASLGVVGGAAPRAQAANCVTLAFNTVTADKGYGSTVWTLDEKSACTDLFAAYARSYADKVKGWYKQSGDWKGGSRGFVSVPKTDTDWKTLLSDIKNGSTVRGQTKSHNQLIQYVW